MRILTGSFVATILLAEKAAALNSLAGIDHGLIAYDGFSTRENAAGTSLHGLSGGEESWISDWTDTTGGSGSDFTVESGSMSYVDSLGQALRVTEGQAVDDGAGVHSYMRRDFAPVDSGTLWVSYLMDGPDNSNWDQKILRPEGGSGDRVFVVRSATGTIEIRTQGGGVGMRTAATSVSWSSGPHLVVLKVDLDANEAHIWADPANLKSLGNADASITGANFGTLGAFYFKSNKHVRATFDEVRIGTNRFEVLPFSQVSTYSRNDFEADVAALSPGDTLVVPDGFYKDWLEVVVPASGTAANPITITAETCHGVTFSGGFKLKVTGSHVIVSCFRFENADANLGTGNYIVYVGGCDSCLVTQNMFFGGVNLNLIRLSSCVNTVVSHNTAYAAAGGGFLDLMPDDDNWVGGNRMEANVLYRGLELSYNGGEALITYAPNKHTGQKTNTEFSYNVLFDWQGDHEFFLFKSGGNRALKNVFAYNKGHFSFRREHENVAIGNLLKGNEEGFRFLGNNHTVLNNIVEDTERSDIFIGDGFVHGSIYGYAAHDCLIAFNTFRNGAYRPFTFYGSTSDPDLPTGNILVNNIVSSDVAGVSLLRDQWGFMVNNTIENNLMYAPNGGVGQASTNPILGDPLFAGEGKSLYIQSGSAAIDAAASYSFLADPLEDFYDQNRNALLRDVGAHELDSSMPTPLSDLPPVPPSPDGLFGLPLLAKVEFFQQPASSTRVVNVIAYRSEGPVGWVEYDFGDGNSYRGRELMVPHEYATGGTYTIQITVFSVEGENSSQTSTSLILS